MPAIWLSVKKSLECKSEPADVHDPQVVGSNLRNIQTRTSRSRCSRSLSNLREIIHGSKRHIEKPPTCSPRSLESTDLFNSIPHEAILTDTTTTTPRYELRFNGFGGCKGGSIKQGKPSPADIVPPRRSSSYSGKGHGDSPIYDDTSKPWSTSRDPDSYDSPSLICKKCRQKFNKLDSFEAHHLSNHAVTELVEGNSSRRVIEIICKTRRFQSEDIGLTIGRIFKVNNMQMTLAQFEEHREKVKINASRRASKHPRCLADGNELLRFYGTAVACSLGLNGSSSLCRLERCGVCQILRHGFTQKEVTGGVGFFTTSASGRAFRSVELNQDDQSVRKALLVCRVIAGRVHRPLENCQEMAGQSGFDSLAGKVGQNSHIEELYLLNPKALLPCFVVICKS